MAHAVALAASNATSCIPSVKVACSTKTFNSQTVEHHNYVYAVILTVVPVRQISHRKYTWLKLRITTCQHYISQFQNPPAPPTRQDNGT